MKKSLLFLASMLLTIPAMVSAATCNVQLKFNPSDMLDWDDLTKGVYLYDFEGNFTEMLPVDSLNVDPDTLYFSADTEATTFCFTNGKCADKAAADKYFEDYPIYRSVAVTLDNGAVFAQYLLMPGKFEKKVIEDWYAVVTTTATTIANFDPEPPYDPSNQLTVNQYNFNNGKVEWYYEKFFNNAGTAKAAQPGYANSAACMVLNTTAKSGDPWGAQALLNLPNALPAGEYLISFYAKADEKDAAIDFGIKNSAGWPNTYEVYAPETILSKDWTKYEYYVVTTKETTMMEVNHGHALGNVFVDCVSISVAEPKNVKTNAFNDDQFNFNNGEVEWYYEPFNNAGTAKAAEVGFMGSKSALLLNTTKKSNNGYEAQTLFKLNSELPAGEYTISFWAKGENVTEENVPEIEFGIKNSDSWPNTYEVYAPTIKLTNNWVKYTYSIATEKPTTKMEFNHGHALGNVFIDCIILQDVEPLYNEKNILSENGYNFNGELTGDSKWYFGNGTWSWNDGSGTAKAIAGAPGYLNSKGCLEFVNGVAAANAWTAQALTNLTEAVPAGFYSLSYYAKADKKGAVIQFGYRKKDGKYENRVESDTLTTDWTFYKHIFQASDLFECLQADFGTYVGNIDIDCLELLAVPTTEVCVLDLSNVNAGAFPKGWKAVDNGNVQEYDKTYGSGPRTFDGFSGQFEKAIYWRNTGSKVGDGYLSYGEQEAYKLHLIPATYMIEFMNLNWSEATDKYSFVLEGNDFSYSKEYATVANPAGSQKKGAIANVPVEKIFIDVPVEGDYVVKFSGNPSWNGYLLGSFSMIGLYEDGGEEPEPEPEPTDIYYLKNYSTGKYLGWDGNQVVFNEDSVKQNFEVALTDALKGQFTTAVSYYAGETKTPMYLSIGGKFGYNFKTNIDADEQGHSYWFEVVDTKFGYIEATKAADVEAGKYYIIIQKYQSYAALGGKVIDTSDDQNHKYRVEGIALPDFNAETDYMMLPTADYNSCVYLLESDVPTLVPTVFEAENNDVIYNTLGQRVNAPVKGINLINGQKILF